MITIIDYKTGNLRSIQNMLKRIGYQSIISSNPNQIKQAENYYADSGKMLDLLSDKHLQIDNTTLFCMIIKCKLLAVVPIFGNFGKIIKYE